MLRTSSLNPMPLARWVLLSALPVLAVAGCGSGGDSSSGGWLARGLAFVPGPADAGLSPDSYITCATETRAMPYVPGMQVSSDAGKFTVKLLDSQPGPPVKGTNTWRVEVDDGTGVALDGLALTITPYMPDHQHGTTPVDVSADGGGDYTLQPLYLYMSGLWEIRFTIVGTMVAGGTSDAAVIKICIP